MKKSRLRDEEDYEEDYEERRPAKSSRAQKQQDRSDLNVLSLIYKIMAIIGCVMMGVVLLGSLTIGIIMMAGIASICVITS